MGAILENLSIDIEDIRNYLRADPADDTLINRLVNAVKAEADRICNNDFKDEKEVVKIPEDVEQWVYEMVAYKYDKRATGLKLEDIDGVGRREWGKPDLTVLLRYRKNPGL